MAKSILGIDLGTSGVKVGILNCASGNLEALTLRAYDNAPQQDTGMLFKTTLDALQETVSAFKDRKDICAMGLSGQMHGAVLYDQTGQIFHPLINWQEKKYSAALVVDKINQLIDPESFNDTGINMASGLTGAILFGIRENYPDLFTRIHKFVLPTDFIRGKLLGWLDYSTDPTNAFSTGLFNIRRSRWQRQMIDRLGLPMGLFPEVHPTSDIAGTLCTGISDILRLPKKIPIIFGGGDNQMGMLGSGLISQASPVLINIGTSSQISMVISDYMRIPGVDTRSYFNGSYALVGASLAGGGSYKWLRETIRAENGWDLSFLEMDRLVAQAPPGAGGLVFCPGPSRNRPERKMGFYAKRAGQDIAYRARAVLEGVLMDLYDLYQEFPSHNSNEIMIGGGKGLQKSEIWSQIAADIFQKPLHITNSENALFGAAIMAAIGVGEYKDLNAAARAIKYDQQIAPCPQDSARYHHDLISRWKSVVDHL